MTHLDDADKLLLAMPLSSGARLGPYEVLELAGAGGMSEVYKARDIRLRRTVALKVLRTRDDGDPAARSRLAREARAIAALNHPHICAIHDVGEWNGQDFLVMEFLEGQTLQDRLARGPLTTDEFFTTATQIAGALVAAHGAGIVHRDLKPSNIMLTRGGVKLLDFGVARQQPTFSGPGEATATMAATVQGDLVGTVPYMAPEQLEGRAVDARTDIFAFGALLFEMATGRRAFDGGSPAAVIAAILGDARPRIAETSPLPRPVLRIISECLARDPDARWQHTADLLRELRWASEDRLALDGSTGGRPMRRRRWTPHALWLSALLASVALSWIAGTRANDTTPARNAMPVVVLMDSPLPGRVYDPRTAEAGGTNADDVTDVLRDLPVIIHKENTSALWHREEQVIGQNPDLVVSHLSCLFDARVSGGQQPVSDHLFEQAASRLLIFFSYVAARNPHTRFIVYSRSVFQRSGGEEEWVTQQEARLPVLKGRLHAFIVPGGIEKATFRDPTTGKLLRARVVQVLGLRQ